MGIGGDVGKYIDFIVDRSDNPEELGRAVLRNITCNRLRAKKPCVVFLTGDSGEGKSFTGLKFLDVVNEEYGIDTLETLNDSVVYTPLEYTQKLNNMLYYKKNNRMDLKNLRVIMIDEAREVVKARLWHSFINMAIADCNAMSRSIKPLVIIVISQFIKDIDSNIRYTLTYYGRCARPLSGRTHFDLFRVWKDDLDLERPRLRKRRVKGYLVSNKRYSLFKPEFEVKLPDKRIVEKYEAENFTAKSKILRKKLEDLMKMLERQMGHEFDKVNMLVDHYIQNPDSMRLIVQRYRNKIRVKKEFKQMHDLTNIEVSEFEKLLIERLAQKGMAEIDE